MLKNQIMTYKTSYWTKRLIGLTLAASSLLAYADDTVSHFEITGYDVQGNTVLSEQDIKELLAPYVGKDETFETIRHAVDLLQTTYRNKGYSLVKVELPEQELNRGVVVMKVVEEHIGTVAVTGNRFFSEDNIRRSMPALKEGASPNMLEVAANLKLANENPQKKTTVQLQAEPDGGVDALVHVTDEKPWSATVYVDNSGDPQSGLNRITGVYQHANIGDIDNILSLQYTTSIAHHHDAKIYGAGYHIPFYSINDSLDLYASYANVNAGTVQVGGPGGLGFGVSGNGTVVGTRYNHNFLRVGRYNSTLSAGLDYKAFHNDISFNGFPLGNNATVHPVSLTYTGNWAEVGTTLNFFLSLQRNIPGGTNGSAADLRAARFGADAHYTLFRYLGIFAHSFPGDWQVRAVVNGQMTGSSLIQGEQFGVGGATSVRGFYERELINDQGRTTNLEAYTPNLCKDRVQCRLLAFYDTGYLSRNNTLFGEIDTQSIGSVGLGFRFNFAPHWTAQTDWAYVVDGSTLSPKNSSRAHFKLLATF